jgi:hypothetical protein
MSGVIPVVAIIREPLDLEKDLAGAGRRQAGLLTLGDLGRRSLQVRQQIGPLVAVLRVEGQELLTNLLQEILAIDEGIGIIARHALLLRVIVF